MVILNIAQKNSIAKESANILARGTQRHGMSLSKFNPIYEFTNDDNELMKFTSVRGHIFDHQLPVECKNWNTYDNKRILDKRLVSLVKSVNHQMREIVRNIEQQSKKADTLILWLDCDREGEAIAFQVIQICRKVNPRIKVKRARFAALTATDIWNAYRNLVQPNRPEAEAVEYRQQIDMRLGCTFTRFQTNTFKKYYKFQENLVLSYGPCQMPTLGFVVQRYLEIKNFKSEKYWVIKCICVLGENEGVEFKWSRKSVRDQFLVNQIIVSMFENCPNNVLVGNVIKKQTNPKKKYRPYPLTTVQLQKLATDKFKMSSAEVMEIAEGLYTKGYISYPRTQTNSFPKTLNLMELLARFKDTEFYGDYVNKLLNLGKFQQPKMGDKNDEAHMPIHPVKVGERNSFTPKEWLIYDMVCRTFFGCCSADAKGEEFQVSADIGGEIFKASYLTIKEKNYLQIYSYDKWTESCFPQIPDTFFPLIELQENKTTPPGYLTESELIGLMEKNQIGTDSTIHQHIQNIQNRRYAVKNSNTFKPTCLGVSLIIAYRKFQIKLPQCEIRRLIENNMNQIQNGRLNKDLAIVKTLEIMVPIYEKLESVQQGWIQSIKQSFDQNRNLQQLELHQMTQQEISKTNHIPNNSKGIFKCQKCHKEIKVVYSTKKESYFLGCSGYPNCKWSSPLPTYIKSISVTDSDCINCKTSKLCQVQAKNMESIEPRTLKYLFSQKQQLKLVLCVKPQCDFMFNDFTYIPNRNLHQNLQQKNSVQTTLNRYGQINTNNNSSNNNNNNNNNDSFQSQIRTRQPAINNLSNVFPNKNNSNHYSLENITCYNCNQKGHYSTNCTQDKKHQYEKQETSVNKKQNKSIPTNKNNNTKNSNVICFKCKQSGHYASNCQKDNNYHTNNQTKNAVNNKSSTTQTKQKKVCEQCGVEGRHPKGSQCQKIKRKKSKKESSQDDNSYNEQE